MKIDLKPVVKFGTRFDEILATIKIANNN